MTLYYGMAQWQHSAWVDWLYPASLPAGERLAKYAQIFSSVEVGSTFYTKVEAGQLKRWHDAVPEHFRFSFKAPRTVSHGLFERSWGAVLSDWLSFMEALAPLNDKMGPTMLQFPSRYDAHVLDKIMALCELWSLTSPLAVEVRHLDYFDRTIYESRFLRALSECGVNRVVMDSRPVFSSEAYCESLKDAQKKKPRVPCHPVSTAKHPVVRFIGHPDLSRNTHWLEQWVKKLAQWLEAGLTPYVFVHSSDNVAAPTLARQLDVMLSGYYPRYKTSIVLPEVQEQIGLW